VRIMVGPSAKDNAIRISLIGFFVTKNTGVQCAITGGSFYNPDVVQFPVDLKVSPDGFLYYLAAAPARWVASVSLAEAEAATILRQQSRSRVPRMEQSLHFRRDFLFNSFECFVRRNLIALRIHVMKVKGSVGIDVDRARLLAAKLMDVMPRHHDKSA